MFKAIHENKRYDVIDLDPYGSANQFLDAAVQAVSDGGLLCITCTDMKILAGGETETNFHKYGTINLSNSPYCHEFALRTVLHTLSVCATRYKRVIIPLVSCSIDFYVRLFVKVSAKPIETKKAASKTSMVFHCNQCKSYATETMGKIIMQDKNVKYKNSYLPVDSKCNECKTSLVFAGPFYSDKIHDREFVLEMLETISSQKFATETRMKGMLTLISEELSDSLFYYELATLSKIISCTTPSLKNFKSALLNAGYKVSLTHCRKNSIKTDAPSAVVWSILRSYVLLNPVKIKEGSIGEKILKNECLFEANFEKHNEVDAPSMKMRRFQDNPAFWGPMSRAKRAKGETEEVVPIEGNADEMESAVGLEIEDNKEE